MAVIIKKDIYSKGRLASDLTFERSDKDCHLMRFKLNHTGIVPPQCVVAVSRCLLAYCFMSEAVNKARSGVPACSFDGPLPPTKAI
jgi:hypothetical protein